MQIDILSQNGEKLSKQTLAKEIFEAKIDLGLVHRALIMQLSNKRQGSAKVKTKGEVRGGGRKPWKQKGTGRARAGSSRSPIWRGGGVTFGPTGEQNYTKDMPKKQRRKALFSALSSKAKDNNILCLESIKLDELKTKKIIEILNKLSFERNALIVTPNKNLDILKTSANIPYIKVIQASYLNIYDLLKYETLIVLKDSFAVIDDLWKDDAKKMYKLEDEKIEKIEEKKEVKKAVVKKSEIKDASSKKPVAKKTVVKKDVSKKPVAKKTVVKKVTKKTTKK
jgi:large subunit ribosomal protein L4